MRSLVPALCLALAALQALADPPAPVPGGNLMTPQDFDSYATGKTLAYSEDGVVWGRETYLPDRRVLWRAVGDDCKMGHWWANGDAVCFSYDDGTTDQCWAFARSGPGLTATFLGDPPGHPSQVTEEPDAVPCPGPDLGS